MREPVTPGDNQDGAEPATQATPADAAGQPTDMTNPSPGVDPNEREVTPGKDPHDDIPTDSAGQP